jgi:hypothetical protein
MNHAWGNVGGLIFRKRKNLITVGNFSRTNDHDPMLSTMVMFLLVAI